MSKSVAAFGATLRAARLAVGQSRIDLARASGITDREIHAIETGARLDPHLSTVLKLAHGLGVPLGELLAPWGS